MRLRLYLIHEINIKDRQLEIETRVRRGVPLPWLRSTPILRQLITT